MVRSDLKKLASITLENGLDTSNTFNHIIKKMERDVDFLQLRLRLIILVKLVKKNITISAKKKLMLQKCMSN